MAEPAPSGTAGPSAISATSVQPAPAASASSEQQRREALRKAGADFLEKALLQKKSGAHSDPFAPSIEVPLAPSPISQRPESRPTASRRRAAKQALPDEVAEFGVYFESTKLYVYCGLYLACQAAIYVLIKGSLTTMKTPGLMSFLHMTSACLSFWGASYYDVFDLRTVTADWQQSLRGVSVRAALFGLQMLLLYGALLHSSVNAILSWAAAVPLLLEAGLAVAAGRRSRLLAPQTLPLLALAAAATVLELLLDGTLSVLSLVMLLLWTATKLAEAGWRMLKEDPSWGGRMPGGDFGQLAGLVRRLGEAEAALQPAPAALLVNALPALPVLLVGFIGQEGNEIVDHELSVPAVKLMLLSCVAHVGITWCQLLLHDRLGGAAKASLRWGGLLGAIAFNFAERTAGASIGTALCAMAAVGASAGAALQRHGLGRGGSARQLAPFQGLNAGGGGGGGAGALDDDEDPES